MTHTSIRLFLLLGLALAFGCRQVTAQTSRTIIVNGGYFEFAPPYSDYVTVGYWDTPTKKLKLVDTLIAQSVTDGILAGDTLFVSTDAQIRSYLLPAFKELATTKKIRGIRKLAKVGGRLLATRGYGTPNKGSYLLGFDANTLTVVDSVPYFLGDLEHILVQGNMAYVGAPGSFLSDTANILEVDLAQNQVTDTYKLDTLGQGLGHIFPYQGALKAYCTGKYLAPKGALATLSGQKATIEQLSFSVGSKTYSFADQVFGNLGSGGLRVADATLAGLKSTPVFAKDIAAAAFDTTMNQFVVTSANFINPGKAYHLRADNGKLVDSIPVGISPEVILIWRQNTTQTKSDLASGLFVFPNPAENALNLSDWQSQGFENFYILSAWGNRIKPVIKDGLLPLEGLASGCYVLVAEKNGMRMNRAFVKN